MKKQSTTHLIKTLKQKEKSEKIGKRQKAIINTDNAISQIKRNNGKQKLRA